MDKKSKIFFIVFFLLIVSSVAVTYYRIVVQRDYMIQAEATCDPYTESCFVYVCDPEAGEECTGDPVEDTSYYKLIDRNAKNIPSCDPNDETCTALICGEGEANCTYTLCDPATAVDGGVCNDPVTYTLENPIEEESSTDVEGDVTGDEAEVGVEEVTAGDEAGAEAGADTTTDATDTTGNVQSDVITPQAGMAATETIPVQSAPIEAVTP